MTLKRFVLIICVGVLPVITWSIIASSESSTPADKKSSHSKTKTINPHVYKQTEEYRLPATIEAAKSVDLYARADGYIEERYVDIGSHVEKGQLLAKLSSPELEDKTHQAQADIRRQQAIVGLTKKLSQRFQDLKETGAVSSVDIEEKIADFEIAKARLKNYEARLEQLDEEYGYTEVRAPFNGVITHRHIEVGQRISGNDPKPLFNLSQHDQLKVIINIPQSKLGEVDAIANPKFVTSDTEKVTDDLEYLRESSELSGETGTMRVEYLLGSNRLITGTTGEVILHELSSNPIYIVPMNTVRMVSGKPSVQVIEGETVTEISVKIKKFMTNDVQITGDLSESSNIIINPNALLDLRT